MDGPWERIPRECLGVGGAALGSLGPLFPLLCEPGSQLHPSHESEVSGERQPTYSI